MLFKRKDLQFLKIFKFFYVFSGVIIYQSMGYFLIISHMNWTFKQLSTAIAFFIKLFNHLLMLCVHLLVCYHKKVCLSVLTLLLILTLLTIGLFFLGLQKASVSLELALTVNLHISAIVSNCITLVLFSLSATAGVPQGFVLSPLLFTIISPIGCIANHSAAQLQWCVGSSWLNIILSPTDQTSQVKLEELLLSAHNFSN